MPSLKELVQHRLRCYAIPGHWPETEPEAEAKQIIYYPNIDKSIAARSGGEASSLTVMQLQNAKLIQSTECIIVRISTRKHHVQGSMCPWFDGIDPICLFDSIYLSL